MLLPLARFTRSCIPYILLTFITILLFSFTYRTWQYDFFEYPLMYNHDGIESVKLTKHIAQGFDHWKANPHLGAPEDSNLYLHFPTADNLNLLILKCISTFTKDHFLIINLYILVTYILVSLSSYLVLTRMGIKSYLAFISALLFSFLPYHQIRTTVGHIFLINYFAVPFSVLIAFHLLFQKKTEDKNSDEKKNVVVKQKKLSKYLTTLLRPITEKRIMLKSILLLLMLLSIGSTGTAYYAFFSIIIWGLAALIGSYPQKTFIPVIQWILLSGVTGLTVLINIWPAIVASIQNSNQVFETSFTLIERNPLQIEEFGLKLNRLFVPLPSSFFPFKNNLQSYLNGVQHESFQFPGFFAFFGLLLILIGLFNRTWESQIFKKYIVVSRKTSDYLKERLQRIGALVIAIVLVFSTGGVALLIGHSVTSSIRAYGRVSISLAFIGIFVLTYALQTISESQKTKKRQYIVSFVAVLIGTYSLLYQIGTHDPHAQGWNIRNLFDADAAFIARVEQEIPEGVNVLQLPLVQYPEARGQCLFDSYDHLRPYLHTNQFNWSFGTLPNSEFWTKQQNWVKLIETEQLELFLNEIALHGYEAIYIDTRSCFNPWDFQDKVGKLTQAKLITSETNHALILDIRTFAKQVNENSTR